MLMSSDFIPQKGYYRKLRVFKIAEVLYDITYMFTQRFFSKGDRTVDQMVQAARSGKQNIAEGSCAGTTSKETEIRLTNVAKSSLHELMLDYEDYLRVRGLPIWKSDSDDAMKSRRICANHSDSAFYINALKDYPDYSIANIAIILLHQADVLLDRLIERQKRDFLAYGGIREQMSAARRAYRDSHRPPQSPQSSRSSQNLEDPSNKKC